jgi:hypothetical protein
MATLRHGKRRCPKGLIKWLSRDEWRDPFNELFERHAGAPCERAGIAFEEVADTIGNQNANVMWGCDVRWMWDELGIAHLRR